MEKNIRKFTIPEVLFGIGSIDYTGRYLKNFNCKKALLVTDKGVLETEWPRLVRLSLEKDNIDYVIYSDVSPNPRDYEVAQGVKVYMDNKCDSIVAVGGGSPMDCAKGIGIVCENGGDILEYAGVDKVRQPMPPIICLPTTAGTAADVSQFAIIKDSNRKNKIAIVSKSIIPDISIIDPRTLTTMPDYLAGCVGMDALAHAVEAYVSNGSSAITDHHALEAARLVHENLPLSIKNKDHLEYGENMMLASMYAGFAFSNASLGAVHALSHSLGGLKDLPHGECNAMLLTSVMDFNFPFSSDRYVKLAEIFHKGVSNEVNREKLKTIVKIFDEFRYECGIKGSLKDKGVKKSEISKLAETAEKDPCLLTNPREASVKDIEEIFHVAY